ncbi:SUMF1/EgtB/PvdO family nonheme iron enzyme [Christiangramia sp. LLG6405-1]|uniref:SUMF1/EgtB/PvdO family nonheme iron enzyme n=1 Tax=Christiangramia sp. LLG6405-1 TaxID=3160832 RepID=UPI00386F3400
MKKILLLILVLNLTPMILLGQKKSNIPPGTIQLNDSIFMDKAPITNIMFLEYLTAKHFLRKKGFDSFSEYYKTVDIKPDRLTVLYPSFLKNLNKDESFLTEKNYFENSKYKYSPVLRISKRQAQDYCKWRTEMVQYHRVNKNKTAIQNIKYRLPTKEELTTSKEFFSQLNKFTFYTGKNPTKFHTDKNINGFILYRISEFTSTDKLFGENWKNINPIEFPNDLTGFRCACELEP